VGGGELLYFNKKGAIAPFCFYFLGFGGLLPRFPPEGFPVLLGAFAGLLLLAIIMVFSCNASNSAFRLPLPMF
jgi:hypothetical protein